MGRVGMGDPALAAGGLCPAVGDRTGKGATAGGWERVTRGRREAGQGREGWRGCPRRPVLLQVHRRGGLRTAHLPRERRQVLGRGAGFPGLKERKRPPAPSHCSGDWEWAGVQQGRSPKPREGCCPASAGFGRSPQSPRPLGAAPEPGLCTATALCHIQISLLWGQQPGGQEPADGLVSG